MITIPTIEPSQLTAGDTIKWMRSLSDYPTSAGWVLNYSLLSLAGSIQIASVPDGESHLVSVDSITSSQYVPGTYSWQSWVTNGTDRFQIGRGTVEILPDYAASGYAAVDTRSHVKRMLDAIEATLEGTATTDQQELTLDGTIIKRRTVADLLKFRQYYFNLYRQELAAEKMAASGAGFSRVRQVVPR